MTQNKQILLDNRPSGEASPDNFKLVTSDVPALQEGEVLVRNHFLSLDPYMKLRMSEGPSYAEPQGLGTVMIGETVGEVADSKNSQLAVGDKVVCLGNWQQYTVFSKDEAAKLRKIDTTHVPFSYYLGATGMPGVTAWLGVSQILKPKAGETLIVSSACGAVGSVVGQLAKARGCRVIGIAGGPDKCRYVEEELGFDKCIDYKTHKSAESIAEAIREAAPNGIDCNFENVGGICLDAIMSCMNDFGRIAVCGYITAYNGQASPITQPSLILTKRLTIQGFLCFDYLEQWTAGIEELKGLVAEGKLKYRETIEEGGLEAAPEAFVGMLKGKNVGKQLVKLV